MSHKNRPTSNRTALIIFVPFTLVCVMAFLIPYLNLQSRLPSMLLTETVIGQNTLATIVPSGGQDIHYAVTSGFQSVHTKIRFTLPSEALKEFILGLCPDMVLQDGGYIHLQNDENISWWKPEDSKIYAAGHCLKKNFETVIDKSNSQYYVVYVELL
jgi:hypothetical protein